ncbi:hypothetical protein GJ496_011812 [Pomphorhynchus laevis]|nr:hypothetical protein GJ496_011812 [Pomphorhynchus laevis]
MAFAPQRITTNNSDLYSLPDDDQFLSADNPVYSAVNIVSIIDDIHFRNVSKSINGYVHSRMASSDENCRSPEINNDNNRHSKLGKININAKKYVSRIRTSCRKAFMSFDR